MLNQGSDAKPDENHWWTLFRKQDNMDNSNLKRLTTARMRNFCLNYMLNSVPYRGEMIGNTFKYLNKNCFVGVVNHFLG